MIHSLSRTDYLINLPHATPAELIANKYAVSRYPNHFNNQLILLFNAYHISK